MELAFLIGLVVVIASIILHEVAHGFVADALGDPTARYAGRLTLNPFSHADPVGSVLLPGILALSGSPFLIGWAKPVPYNPFNLSNQRYGEALVAAAGPATNILLALIGALVVRFGAGLPDILVSVAAIAVIANLSLALLNLIPFPPLDGSKILRTLLPSHLKRGYLRLEQATESMGTFGLIGILLIFVFVLSGPVSVLVYWLFSLLTGV